MLFVLQDRKKMKLKTGKTAVEMVEELLKADVSWQEIAKRTGYKRTTIFNIKRNLFFPRERIERPQVENLQIAEDLPPPKNIPEKKWVVREDHTEKLTEFEKKDMVARKKIMVDASVNLLYKKILDGDVKTAIEVLRIAKLQNETLGAALMRVNNKQDERDG